MTERPNAQDYRNKGERDAAYWREQADKLADACKPFSDQADEIDEVGAKHHIEPGAIIRKVSYDACVNARTALAEYNAVRLA